MEKDELIKNSLELQRKVDRARRQYQLDIWMSLPLTIAQLKSLFFINDHGSTHSGELASALAVTPTNITGIVDRLVKQGLVNRTENPDNRRMLLLRATDKGGELVAKLRERRIGYMSGVLECMTKDELALFNRGLALLVTAVETSEKRANKENG